MFYKALRKKYEAEIEESLATLRIYLKAHQNPLYYKSVGNGEHSGLITELDKYVSKLATAEDNLATLERHIDTLAPEEYSEYHLKPTE